VLIALLVISSENTSSKRFRLNLWAKIFDQKFPVTIILNRAKTMVSLSLTESVFYQETARKLKNAPIYQEEKALDIGCAKGRYNLEQRG
jgi:hypothetical protein